MEKKKIAYKSKRGEQLPNSEMANLEDSNSNLQVLRLEVEGMVPQFDKDIQEYYLNLPSTIQNLEVLAISQNPDATVEIIGNTNLQDGLNDITIQVTSKDKSQSKYYRIHVTKTADLELANTNLEILAVENVLLNPPFDTSITSYEIEVSNEMENINVFAVPENEKATVEINGKDKLQEGNNLVTVTVTAPNGFTKKIYKMEVYKRNLEEERAFQVEQEKRKEDLENAYKMQEVSSDVNSFQQQVTKNQNKKYQGILFLGVITAILILGLAGVVWRIKKK